MAKPKPVPLLKLGDRVRIRLSGGLKGRIVELRGPLGPGGAQIYRVRIPRKPKPQYIEVREDQLETIPADSCSLPLTAKPRNLLQITQLRGRRDGACQEPFPQKIRTEGKAGRESIPIYGIRIDSRPSFPPGPSSTSLQLEP